MGKLPDGLPFYFAFFFPHFCCCFCSYQKLLFAGSDYSHTISQFSLMFASGRQSALQHAAIYSCGPRAPWDFQFSCLHCPGSDRYTARQAPENWWIVIGNSNGIAIFTLTYCLQALQRLTLPSEALFELFLFPVIIANSFGGELALLASIKAIIETFIV